MSDSDHLYDKKVTVVVSRLVKPGYSEAYERLIKRINHEAMQFDGYLGYHVIRPDEHQHPEYVTILKFESFDSLKQWEASPARGIWLGWIDEFTEGQFRTQKLTGLEYWFIGPNLTSISPPSREKQTIVIILALLPTVSAVNAVLTLLLDEGPPLLRLFLSITITGHLMTYAVMPFMTRVFRFWLRPERT